MVISCACISGMTLRARPVDVSACLYCGVCFCCRLTAFVLKVLHASLVSQWTEELYVPVDLLDKMAMWLVEQQQPSGAFIEKSGVYYNINYFVSRLIMGADCRWVMGITRSVVSEGIHEGGS